MVNRCLLFIFGILIYSPYSYGQQFHQAIEDNSFFIEEAYNQEFRVVQHISTGYYQTKTKDFVYTFTQEWPLGCQTHQLSYTIPYQSLGAGFRGLGNIYLNYRYQLWDAHNWALIAPRLSIIIPTGNSSRGLGNGVAGAEINLPVSKRFSNEFISHLNIGITLLPHVKGTTVTGGKVYHTLLSPFAGISGIWLITENYNLMCEVLWRSSEEIETSGSIVYSSETIVSPGFRYAINIGELQIVPGIALPFAFNSKQSALNVFGYLSFEHPF